jgi:ABC-2 type transport system permease protein
MRNVFTIFRKETGVFFNSLIAYVVMSVFLTGNGLFFWIFGDNVLETGAAELSTLFALSPWFFLFLIPAITMRSFAEEIRTGTIDLLFSRPLTRWEILLGKYLSACALVVFSVFPTLIYFATIWYLGNPTGNLDVAASSGAYIGLLFLGFSFASIGIFASTLTTNQILAFILAVFISFITYTGFDFIAELPWLASYNEWIIQFGMIEHFRSISRGVVDSRDLLYFFSLSAIFLLLSDLNLQLKKP